MGNMFNKKKRHAPAPAPVVSNIDCIQGLEYTPWSTPCHKNASGSFIRTRNRIGDIPASGSGILCPDTEEYETCDPIDGVWSDWTKDDPSVSCGPYLETRNCNEPKYGGLPCVGAINKINQQLPCITPNNDKLGPYYFIKSVNNLYLGITTLPDPNTAAYSLVTVQNEEAVFKSLKSYQWKFSYSVNDSDKNNVHINLRQKHEINTTFSQLSVHCLNDRTSPPSETNLPSREGSTFIWQESDPYCPDLNRWEIIVNPNNTISFRSKLHPKCYLSSDINSFGSVKVKYYPDNIINDNSLLWTLHPIKKS